MTEQQLWKLYLEKHPDEKRDYTAWSFGGDAATADKLAQLVLEGTKTATSSAYPLYEIEGYALPEVGGLNIILDSDKNAVAITETTRVYTCPFGEVTEEHAYLEGEGDRSLSFWRLIHQVFFTRELFIHDLNFGEDMLVVCEEFRLIQL